MGSQAGTHELWSIFSHDDVKKKADKEEQAKVKTILQRLNRIGITTLTDRQVEYALRSKASGGDSAKALELLIIFEDSLEGIIKPYNPATKLLGAENREGVTCYLDALLFAMFARLDSFEAMLYNNFEDEA
ncbi:hypothetical protein LTR04_001147 [Oleoguttula sp. CCFEE 6159]|nr:hypothetical protein LTR04_001147 [Oleoguttula sp. CCFEE 6159]